MSRKRKSQLRGSPFKPKPRLAPLHRCLVDEYFKIGCRSKKRAALAAGYAMSSAMNISTVFNRPDVAAEVERRWQALDRKQEVTEERILQEYAKIAFVSPGDLLEVADDGTAVIDLTLLTPSTRAAIVEYSTEEEVVEAGKDEEGDALPGVKVRKSKIKFGSKQAALDSLARIKGMFKDRVEMSGSMSLMERIQKARDGLAGGKS